MNIYTNILLALKAIKSNLLRTTLTFSIIAVGITALVGILTAIEGIKSSVNSNFSSMGANGFSIEKYSFRQQMRSGKVVKSENLTLSEARQFISTYNFPSTIALSTLATQIATLKSKGHKTNPNVRIQGVNASYFKVNGFEIEEGHTFTEDETVRGMNLVILGKSLADVLFPNTKQKIGKYINIGSMRYVLVGVLAEKGSSSGFGGDAQAYIPLLSEKNNFNRNNRTYTIQVALNNEENVDAAIDEAIGTMRVVRRIYPGEENDFYIEKSDLLAGTLGDLISYLTIGAFIIGLITLFGSALGLLNIMLVLVTERTREIGVCKSIGATAQHIRIQFLTEAIVICLIGGIFGIIFGILIGNIVALALGAPFIIPWLWIFVGLIFCFSIGILAGIYPANRASKLNPIESLRYE